MNELGNFINLFAVVLTIGSFQTFMELGMCNEVKQLAMVPTIGSFQTSMELGMCNEVKQFAVVPTIRPFQTSMELGMCNKVKFSERSGITKYIYPKIEPLLVAKQQMQTPKLVELVYCLSVKNLIQTTPWRASSRTLYQRSRQVRLIKSMNLPNFGWFQSTALM